MTNEDFPKEKFIGCLGHFLNPNASERGNAIRSASKMCTDAGLTFQEGCALAYGTDGDSTQRVAELEDQLRQCEHDTAELVAQYEARLKKGGDGAEETIGVKSFLRHTWSFPQCRLVMLCIIFAAALSAREGIPAFGGLLLFVSAVWMFLLWCTVEHYNEGYGPLLIKVLLMAAGFGVVWVALPGPNFLILILVMLLLAFRLIENVMDWLADLPTIGKLVEWIL